MRRLPISLLIALILLLTSSGAYSQDQWPYYGGTQWGERHVKFSQIGKHNVAHLVTRRGLLSAVVGEFHRRAGIQHRDAVSRFPGP
jgi:hypothetical protein